MTKNDALMPDEIWVRPTMSDKFYQGCSEDKSDLGGVKYIRSDLSTVREVDVEGLVHEFIEYNGCDEPVLTKNEPDFDLITLAFEWLLFQRGYLNKIKSLNEIYSKEIKEATKLIFD